MMVLIILLVIITLIMSYSVLRSVFFFRNSGIPYKTPWPLIGNMGPILFKRVHVMDHINNYCQRWPDAKYIGFFDFMTPVLIIRDSDLIKSVGVKNFEFFSNHRNLVDDNADVLFSKSLFGLKGHNWKEVRNSLSPFFTTKKMKEMFMLMLKRAQIFTIHLKNSVKDNSGKYDIDIKDAFMRYTNDVITVCAFGIEIDSLQNENNAFYMNGKKAVDFSGIQAVRFLITRSFPKLANFLNIHVLNNCVTEFFINVIDKIIQIRQNENMCHSDLLQLLNEAKKKKNISYDLSNLDFAAHAFTFYFAGLESSSSLMSFASVLLALHSDVQESVQKEVDDVLLKCSNKLTYENINEMPYLDAILYETLRCYPIIPFVDRVCINDLEFPPALPGLKPFVVKPGTNLWFPTSGVHKDSAYYNDPEVFNPNRFLNKKVQMNESMFLSFGIGPRACIGNRFALLETKVVLFYLLANFSLEISPKLQTPLTLNKSSFNSSIEGGFWLKILQRNK